jgi:DNA-directed RNA polymerase sigma subunit (sigma70/sigma32)
MELMVWNVILSFASAFLMFWVKVSYDEVKRLSILLSKTREENAEKYVTKADVHSDINRVLTRLDRLESKIDDFMKEQRSALS